MYHQRTKSSLTEKKGKRYISISPLIFVVMTKRDRIIEIGAAFVIANLLYQILQNGVK